MIGMPLHKLLITMRIIPPEKYKELLSDFETTTGLPTKFSIKIRNIGEEDFPGGVFIRDETVVETNVGMTTIATRGTVTLSETESIRPKGFVEIDADWTARVSGPSRILIGIKPKDKARINFYRTKGGSPSDMWYDVFAVVDRHQLDIALLLGKLLEKR